MFKKKGQEDAAPPVAQNDAKKTGKSNEAETTAKAEPKPAAEAAKWRGAAAAKGRDFDAEARGKTRCALEEAWAQSPLLPMLVADPSDKVALHALLDELVTERMRRVFPNG